MDDRELAARLDELKEKIDTLMSYFEEDFEDDEEEHKEIKEKPAYGFRDKEN